MSRNLELNVHVSNSGKSDYCFRSIGSGYSVVGLFSGHGGKFGNIAAEASAIYMKRQFDDVHNIRCLRQNHVSVLNTIFQYAHYSLRRKFALGCKLQQTKITNAGVFKRFALGTWTPIHGGTTATVIICTGTTIIVAYVGDSSAIVQGADSYEYDHSPKNMHEYMRVREETNNLKFVYAPCESRGIRNIYDHDEDGIRMTNVDGCAAVMVDGVSLRITRSLGDFFLHNNGVSHEPTISLYDAKVGMRIFAATTSFWSSVVKDEFRSRKCLVGDHCGTLVTIGVHTSS